MAAQLGVSIEVLGIGPFRTDIAFDEALKGEFSCRHIDGILIGEDTCLIDQDVQQGKTLLDIEKSNGEWLGIFENPRTGQIAVCSDPFGYQTIFYTIFGDAEDRVALLSASAAGMAALLRKYQVPVDPDWTHIVGNLVSERPWTKTMSSNRTNLNGVRVLAPGEILILGADFSGVTKSDFFEAQSNSYTHLLQKGINRAISQIESASRLPVNQREIRLSGGRDSRIMMAMLVASGMADQFTITAVNPATWPSVRSRPGLERDLQISAKMASRYGLSWSKARPGVRTRLTFDEAVAAWQTPFSNKNFELRTGAIHFMPDSWALELRGGAGETFRGFRVVSGLLNRLDVSKDTSVDEGVEALADHLYGRRNLPNGIGANLSLRLAELFDHLGTDNLAEGLHRRFAVYRNRAHFGHIRDSASKRSLPILPLSQPEFVEARNFLSYEEQVSGVIAYDIVDLLVPELNNLEFDDGPWRTDQLYGRPRVDISRFDLDVSAALQAYEAGQKRDKKILKQSEVRRGNIGKFDPATCISEMVIDAIDELRGFPGAELNFPQALGETLKNKVLDGSRNPNMMLAKALGVLDLSRTGQRPNSIVIPLGGDAIRHRLRTLESGPPVIRWADSAH